MGFSILRGTTVESLDPAHLQGGFKETSCDFPTLLHFSAHHGLERLTSVLLECPGAVLANQMKPLWERNKNWNLEKKVNKQLSTLVFWNWKICSNSSLFIFTWTMFLCDETIFDAKHDCKYPVRMQ